MMKNRCTEVQFQLQVPWFSLPQIWWVPQFWQNLLFLGQNFLNAANLSCSTNFKSFDGGAFRQAICKNSETTPSQFRSKSIIQPPLIGCWWLWFWTRLRIPHPEHPSSRQAILDNLARRKSQPRSHQTHTENSKKKMAMPIHESSKNIITTKLKISWHQKMWV